MSELACWTIYERPLDYPHGYVLRRSVVQRGAIIPDAHAFYGDLACVRAHLPPGLLRVQTPGQDPDPHIYEVWM